MGLRSAVRDVATAGTAVRLVTTQHTHVMSRLKVRGAAGNTGDVFIGNAGVDNTAPGVAPDEELDFDCGPHGLDLFDVYVDADTNGNDIEWWGVDL